MDAIKYFEESDRMCKTYTTCEGCPLEPKDTYDCIKDSVKAVAIVEKWAEEHPQKTILSDFLEKFPKANGIEVVWNVCVKHLGYESYNNCGMEDEDCAICWNRPLE